jgi:hypothetical protein
MMRNARLCFDWLWPIATALVVMVGSGHASIVLAQGPRDVEPFIERVRKDGLDELVSALGKRREDHNVIQTCSMGGDIGPPSYYHSILCDYRVAKIRKLIAAMPEEERSAAAERVFDLKIEEFEKGLRPFAEGQKLQPGEEPFRTDYGFCAVGAALMLCAEFCPASSTLERLEYAETHVNDAMAALSRTAPANDSRLINWQEFDPLLEVNLLLHLLNQHTREEEIAKVMSEYERNMLIRKHEVRWNLARNEPDFVIPEAWRPGEKVAIREGAYRKVHFTDPKAQREMIARLKSLVRKSEPGKPGPAPKTDAK